MDNSTLNLETAGREMHGLAAELYPICRAVAGEGVRQTLAVLQKHIPLEVREVPTGTKVFDWEVPQEWHVHDAYIKDRDGRRLVDFRRSNLHVFGGSMPIGREMPWRELKDHLFSLPEHPEWIPYRRAFHQNTWGFCVTHNQFLELEGRGNQVYDVSIDATRSDGSLSYGELYLPGETSDEVLVSTHVCHPSMANDNLSGIVVSTRLAKHMMSRHRRYSYRFIYSPATIGAITWLAVNEARVSKIKHGLVLGVLGDSGDTTYRRSRQGNAPIDRAVAHVLAHSGAGYEILDFEPFGYDQRQFCSPGFDLPVGCLMRTPDGQYPEYHTSADNLDLVTPHKLADSWAKCVAVADVLDGNRTYLNLKPKCEPRLDAIGLYSGFNFEPDRQRVERAALWILNLSDGSHDLMAIAERSGFDCATLGRTAKLLVKHGFLKEISGDVDCFPVAHESGNLYQELPAPVGRER